MPQDRKIVQLMLRWLKVGVAGREGGDSSLMNRIRDAIRLAGVILTGVLSRRPVRPLGDEARRLLPGDELVSGKLVCYTNGITIRARPADIWPWLVQLGCRRAGWYSYDRLDNGGLPSAARIVPALQHVQVGDIIPWTPTARDGFIVQAIEPQRALVLGEQPLFSMTLVLQPVDGTSTRLLARAGASYQHPAVGLMLRLLMHPIHFGMQRRQLLNLKRRVETTAAAGSR
jgi:hypothetical protein